MGIGERESRRGWGQQLVVRGQLHSPMVKLVMRVAHVAPIRARCFNSKRTSFHVALELEHVESVDLRSAIRKADAVLPAFARAGQRGDTLKRVARRGRCRLFKGVESSASKTCSSAKAVSLLTSSDGAVSFLSTASLAAPTALRVAHLDRAIGLGLARRVRRRATISQG